MTPPLFRARLPRAPLLRAIVLRAIVLRAALACAALLPVPASRGADAARELMIGTGAVTGIYYQAGNAVCRLVQRDARSDGADGPVACGAMMTGGSVVNVAALRGGSVDAALIQSDVLAHAVRGTGLYQGRADDKLRALFSLHGEPFQLLVARRLRLTGFGDLRGRKVSTGETGTVLNEAFAALMARHGLTDASFAQTLHLPAADQVSAFCDGDVEAVGMLVGAPFAAFRHAIKDCDGELLDLDSAADRRLIAETPAYAPAAIPRGTYPGIDRDVTTFGVVAVAVTTADMPEAVVYRAVRAVFEHLDEFRAMHPALGALDARRMVADGITAPLHPGAIRYFREKGLL